VISDRFLLTRFDDETLDNQEGNSGQVAIEAFGSGTGKLTTVH